MEWQKGYSYLYQEHGVDITAEEVILYFSSKVRPLASVLSSV
jgi:hypothetical protein